MKIKFYKYGTIQAILQFKINKYYDEIKQILTTKVIKKMPF